MLGETSALPRISPPVEGSCPQISTNVNDCPSGPVTEPSSYRTCARSHSQIAAARSSSWRCTSSTASCAAHPPAKAVQLPPLTIV